MSNEVSNENIPHIEITPSITIADVEETNIKKPIGDSIILENCDKDETKKTNKTKHSMKTLGCNRPQYTPKKAAKKSIMRTGKLIN